MASSDGFSPSFLLRLILPDQSLMPTTLAQLSHILPRIASQSRPWDSLGGVCIACVHVCVRVCECVQVSQVGALLSLGLHPGECRVASYHDHIPSLFKVINLIASYRCGFFFNS